MFRSIFLLLFVPLFGGTCIPFSVNVDPYTTPHDYVSVVSGDALQQCVDHTLICAEPLSLYRTYVSSDEKTSYSYAWRTGDRSRIVAYLDSQEHLCAYLVEPSGAVINFRLIEGKKDLFTPSGPCLTLPYGSHIGRFSHRNYLLRWKENRIELTMGSGERRIFVESPLEEIDEHRPSREEWEGRIFVLSEAIKPNRRRLEYSSFLNPSNPYQSLCHYSKVTVKPFGDYMETCSSHLVGSRGIEHITSFSDGYKVRYQFELPSAGNNPHILLKQVDSGGRSQTYWYEKGHLKLLSANAQGMPQLAFTYYGHDDKKRGFKDFQGWVKEQKGPLGPNGEMGTYIAYVYAYCEREKAFKDYNLVRTDVHDCCGGHLAYTWDFDTKSPLDIFRINPDRYVLGGLRLYWERGSPPSKEPLPVGERLIGRMYYDNLGYTLWAQYFSYDERGNLTQDIQTGILSGTKGTKKELIVLDSKTGQYVGPETFIKSFTYSGDGLNLKTSESWGEYSAKFDYYPKTELLKTKEMFLGEELIKRETFDYDDAGCLTEQCIEDGSSVCLLNRYAYDSHGLMKEAQFFYLEEGQERLLRKEIYERDQLRHPLKVKVYDANGTFCFFIATTHSQRGLLLSKTDPLGQTTTYTYDAHENLIGEKGPRGDYEVVHTYDAAHRRIATEKRSIDGKVWKKRFGYDGMSRKTFEIDEAEGQHTFTYDIHGRLIKQQLPYVFTPEGWQQPISTATYDAADRPIELKDPCGDLLQIEYNSRSQKLKVTHADGTFEQFTYYLDGRLASETSRDGVTTLYERDGLDRILSKTTPSGTWSYTYDGSYLTSETDPEGCTTHYTYDGSGRLIQTLCCGEKTTYFYDALGRKIMEERPLTTTFYEYDLLNRLTAQETHGKRTEYEFDADGNPTVVRERYEGVVREACKAYDPSGRVISHTDALGYTTLTYYVPHNGVIHKTVVHPLGNQTYSLESPEGVVYQVAKLAPNGMVLTVEDFLQDLCGRKVAQRTRISHEGVPNGAQEVKWVYEKGRLIALNEENGRTTRYQYNALGQLIATHLPSGKVISRSYDASGRLATLDSYVFSYDRCDRLLSDGVIERTYDLHGRLLTDSYCGLTFSHAYDAEGRRTSFTFPDQTQVEYSYDPLHLKSVSYLGATHRYLIHHISGRPELEELPLNEGLRWSVYDLLGQLLECDGQHYAYDSLGNCILYQGISYSYNHLSQLDAVPVDSVYNSLDVPHNTSNQREDQAYDLDGNCISGSRVYDNLGRLIQVGDIHYTYDSLNRRLTRNGEPFFYDDLCEVGDQKNIRILGQGLGAELGAATMIFIGRTPYIPRYDHRGCITQLGPSTFSYTPYGVCTANDPLNNPWRFCSKRFDFETELTYFGQRDYDAAQGRWLTPDPLGYEPGPNRYAFCNSNPLSQIDLWGLEPKSKFSKAIGWAQEKFAKHFMLPGWSIRERWMRDGAERRGRAPDEAAIHPTPTVKHVDTSKLSSSLSFFLTLGILTDDVDSEETCRGLARYSGGLPIEMVTNPSKGLLGDLLFSVLYLLGKEHPAVPVVRDYIRERLDGMEKHALVCWTAFSQGTIISKQTLEQLEPEYRAKIYVWAMGGPVSIGRDQAAYVCNFRCQNDIVAWMGGYNQESLHTHVKHLGTRRNWLPLFGEHRMLGGLYEQQFETLAQEVLKEAA